MFSGLLRSTVLTILALIGLLMLCIPMARADEEPILSVYMSNAGLHLTFGVSSSPDPLYENSLNTWESAEFYGHPPSLAFNDSPLVFFRHMLQKAAPEIRQQLQRLNITNKTLKVYVAAAGADAAKNKPLPNSTAINLLSKEQIERCYIHGSNRKDFFACTFKQEVLQEIMPEQDQTTVDLRLEQDHHLITAMGGIYSGQANTEKAAIIVHSTTISQPYLVKNGRALDLGSWVPHALRKNGGIYQIGVLLQQYLNQHGSDPLRYVLEHDSMVANHPQGAQPNMKRLQMGNKGYNNFGHITAETANGLTQNRIRTDGSKNQSEIYAQARQAALPMLSSARKDFLRLTLMLYAMEEKRFNGVVPQLIVVGEEAEIMFANEKVFRKVASNLLTLNPAMEMLPAETYQKRTDLQNASKRRSWLDTKGHQLLQNVAILPKSDFARLQHQSSVLKFAPKD